MRKNYKMIYNLSDLKEYQRNLWNKLGSSQSDNSLLLNERKEELNSDKIEYQVGIFPNICNQFIKKYDLNNIEIGYFHLSIMNKNKCFLYQEFLKEKNLICIGSRPDYTVCVARPSKYFNEDQIVLIDDEIFRNENNPRPEDIQVVADDIEQFLIIIGNLNQLHREVDDNESNYDEKRDEFVNRLRTVNVNEKYYDFWRLLF